MTASTSSLARRFKVDVSTDNTTWIPFKGINDLNPDEAPTLVSVADYDNGGFDQFAKTLSAWSLTAKFRRITTAGVFDPGQELLRACRFQFGTAAQAYVRWYDRNGAPEAYSGLAWVDWKQSKTGVADVEEVTVTLKGDGFLTPITNPYNAALAPVITSATPSGIAAGGLVRLQGAYFTTPVATTGVKFGGVNATSWDFISDSLIEAVMPAGTAGSAPVIVTNSVGASNSFPYTRG
jgi:IPT/TIG domain